MSVTKEKAPYFLAGAGATEEYLSYSYYSILPPDLQPFKPTQSRVIKVGDFQ